MVSILTGDVFAGVGPIALAAARIVKRVYANDLNPDAVEFMEQNSVVNKLEKRIEVSTNSKPLCFKLYRMLNLLSMSRSLTWTDEDS